MRHKADTQIYTGLHGGRLDSGKPGGWLGDLDAQWAATPERVELAKRYFEEARLEDFDALSETLLQHRETGEQYRFANHDPFMAADPSQDVATHFIFVFGQLRFLKPRGARQPVATKKLGTLISGEVRAGVASARSTTASTCTSGEKPSTAVDDVVRRGLRSRVGLCRLVAGEPERRTATTRTGSASTCERR